jgi:hypothetical protein
MTKGEYRVRVQPGSTRLPPLEYAVDVVETRASWKRGGIEGKAKVSLRVRLILGNGALCANQGALELHHLLEVPEWLDAVINLSLPDLGDGFLGFQVI